MQYQQCHHESVIFLGDKLRSDLSNIVNIDYRYRSNQVSDYKYDEYDPLNNTDMQLESPMKSSLAS